MSTCKSHVSMEQHICVVCGKEYDTGTILLDKRLSNSLERTTLTAWGMCPEHKKARADGFIAMIGIDEEKSSGSANGHITPEDAYRTGPVLHLKDTTWDKIMNVPAPERGVCFVDMDVIDMLSEIVNPKLLA